MRITFNSIFPAVLIGIVAAISYYVFVAYSINYHLSDAYYYSAMADGFLESGYFNDLTISPKGPALTPQNGIVFIHVVLIRLGIADQATRFIVIESILFANLLLILLMLHKIAAKLEITQPAARLLLVSFSLSYYMYAYWVVPLNDGVFASATLAVIFMVLTLETAPAAVKARIWIGLLCLAAILGAFRLQGISIFLAAAGASLLTAKKLRPALGFLSLAAFGYVVTTILAVFTIDDFSTIRQFAAESIARYTVDGILTSFKLLADDAIPSAFLNFPAGRLGSGFLYWLRVGFSAVVLFLVIYATISSIKNRRFGRSFLFLYVILTICALFAFQVVDRYFYIAMPIIWLLFVSHLPLRRNFQVIAACAALSLALGTLFGRVMMQDVSFVENRNNLPIFRKIVAAKNYKLISEEPRITHFLFDRPSLVSDSDVQSGDYVVAVGQAAFVEQVLSRLKLKFGVVEALPMNLKWDLLYSVPGPDSDSVLIHVEKKIVVKLPIIN